MTYNELLKKESWYEKCVEILHRDQYRCQKCGALGYHNKAYYECRTADELDSLLKGILIKDDKPSVYIEKNRKCSSSNIFLVFLHKNEELDNISSLGGNYFYDLHITPNIHFSPFILPTISKIKIQEKRCKGSYLLNSKKDVLIPLEMDLQFNRGIFFYLDNSYFDKYVVRIEKRWPTGACADNNYGGGVIMWGSIFISICYQNRCISLEFYDRTSVDNEGNYLETPITPKVLNVHHKYYVNGNNPWEYDNEALVTLCEDCHCDIHKSAKTPVYKELYGKQFLRYAEVCDRCGGSGYLPQYRHVEGGICFKCWGEGVISDPRDIERYLQRHGQTSTIS